MIFNYQPLKAASSDRVLSDHGVSGFLDTKFRSPSFIEFLRRLSWALPRRVPLVSCVSRAHQSRSNNARSAAVSDLNSLELLVSGRQATHEQRREFRRDLCAIYAVSNADRQMHVRLKALALPRETLI
ncbi:hypothetical protein [Burkholderia cepacia]|uniref:hypothetical protein n=1 Tax=Burkholderia cepacia TaxID=292 RepID=UPI000B1A52B2|nr:hypothetical protein [Burkholderia cepacia]